MDSRF